MQRYLLACLTLLFLTSASPALELLAVVPPPGLVPNAKRETRLLVPALSDASDRSAAEQALAASLRNILQPVGIRGSGELNYYTGVAGTQISTIRIFIWKDGVDPITAMAGKYASSDYQVQEQDTGYRWLVHKPTGKQILFYDNVWVTAHGLNDNGIHRTVFNDIRQRCLASR